MARRYSFLSNSSLYYIIIFYKRRSVSCDCVYPVNRRLVFFKEILYSSRVRVSYVLTDDSDARYHR